MPLPEPPVDSAGAPVPTPSQSAAPVDDQTSVAIQDAFDGIDATVDDIFKGLQVSSNGSG